MVGGFLPSSFISKLLCEVALSPTSSLRQKMHFPQAGKNQNKALTSAKSDLDLCAMVRVHLSRLLYPAGGPGGGGGGAVLGRKRAQGQEPKKVDHKGKMFTHIPAQMASPSPPLGSQLGQVGINIAAFVKDFNLKTSIYKEGVPIPTYVTVNPDRSYNMRFNHPPWAYFIKQAAGVPRGAMDHETEVVGYLTRKHVYEIAKLKSEDMLWQEFDLQVICEKVIDVAYQMGVRVVDEIDPVEYKAFLENQARIVEEQKAELQAVREAKLLRTIT